MFTRCLLCVLALFLALAVVFFACWFYLPRVDVSFLVRVGMRGIFRAPIQPHVIRVKRLMTYNPALPAPSVHQTQVWDNGSDRCISDSADDSTALPEGMTYGYKITGVIPGGTEESKASQIDKLAFIQSGPPGTRWRHRAPHLIFVNNDNGAYESFNVYRSLNDHQHSYFLGNIAKTGTYGEFADNGSMTPTAVREPGEALADSIPATGYSASVKGRVYQGDECAVTILPMAAPIPDHKAVRFARALDFTLTDSDGQSAAVKVPQEGGAVFMTMRQSGSKTVLVSSGGAFVDPVKPFDVTVLPGLRVTGHSIVKPAPFPGDLSSPPMASLELLGTIQGRSRLVFEHGETVGFIVPYQDVFRNTTVRATRWEVTDFYGSLVDGGTVNLSGASATIVTAVKDVGNYRFALYDGARTKAGLPDAMGFWSFCVLAPGAPIFGPGGNAGLPGAYGAVQYEVAGDAKAIAAAGALNGFTSSQKAPVNFVRRSFIFTPAANVKATLSVANPGRITVNGQVVQTFPLQFFSADRYTPVDFTFIKGTAYTITVETFQPRGAAVADLTSNVVGMFTSATLKSLANLVGAVTIQDYPAYRVTNTGDHNNVGFRRILGAAGSLCRYPLYHDSTPDNADLALSLRYALALEHRLGNVGAVDAARERRRVLFNLPQLTKTGARDGVYSPAGLKSFLQKVIANLVTDTGLSADEIASNFAIEFDNEPYADGGWSGGAEYAAFIPDYSAAVKAANSHITIIGPGCVSIDAKGRAWMGAFLSAGGGAHIDGFSFHCYNDVEGNFGNGENSMELLKALLVSHGLGNMPLWQTEQGYPDAYNGKCTPRLALRCLGVQLALFDQYGLPCERNSYWYIDGEYVGRRDLMMSLTKGSSVYPNTLLLRTWSAELAGKTFVNKYSPAAPWNKIIKGNFYSGAGGNAAVLLTDGETSLDMPVTLTGVSSGVLTVVRWDGKTSKVAVSGGAATLNIGDLPTFVRLPTGATLTLNPSIAGTNLAAGIAPTSTFDLSNAALMTDGDWKGTSRVGNFGPVSKIHADTAQCDVPLDVNFGSAQTFNCVTLTCPMPFQLDNSLLDFALQKWTGSAWETFHTVTEEVRAYPQYSVNEPYGLIDYSALRSMFVCRFAAQTASKLRVLVYAASCGECATKAMRAYTTSDAVAAPQIREIGVYNLLEVEAPLADPAAQH